MPKAATLQSGFTTGEISPLFYGAVENPRYKKGLATGENYIPVLQGPLVRRPGSKYAGAVKDSTTPPILVPFKFSATQNFMLEFGDNYIRFFANNNQVVTSGTTFKIFGASSGTALGILSFLTFWATRDTTNPQPYEQINSTATITGGNLLELGSPYRAVDLPLLRWRQKGDTIYLTHPNYPLYKLQRQTNANWKIQAVYLKDGPYLQGNTYATVGDNVGTLLAPQTTSAIGATVMVAAAGTGNNVSNATSGAGGQILITTAAAHGFTSGQKVFLYGVGGTVEANNYSNTFGRTNITGPASWTILVTGTAGFLLLGSVFVNAFTAGGNVLPALFAISAAQAKAGTSVQDFGRQIALTILGIRYWGYITIIDDAATIVMNMGGNDLSSPVVFPSTTTATIWYLGAYCGQGIGTGNPADFAGLGYPTCSAFHQNRLWLSGAANSPQQLDSSNTGLYETFSPSDPTSLQVTDKNSCSFIMTAEDSNPIVWMESTLQGLLAGSAVAEWSIAPTSNQDAITPTNFNAAEPTFFGSAPVDSAKVGNAVVHVQQSQRKLRELMFNFFQGTYRSTDLTEISEHITLPALSQIVVQKETQPLIWGRRSDGVMTTLLYNRDDVALSAGWTRHILGGRSDSAGSAPVVLSMGVIPDPLLSFQQLWMVVKRYINGATVCTVEYLTKINDASIAQEDSFQMDCGGTLDSPKTITAITTANPAVVTVAAHGWSNGDEVRLSAVVGLNQSTSDINGNVTINNLVNGKVFKVASATTNTFALHDVSGNNVDSTAYGVYVSGGQARKMVTTVSGITWLENETVSVLADGGIHPDCVVSNSGAITLSYPAAKVQVGFRFKSRGKALRSPDGSAIGTSLGQTRRTTRVAVQMDRTGDLALGTSFSNLIPVNFGQADQNNADSAIPLFSGIIREGLESASDFDSQVHFEQSSPLPGTIQSMSYFLEEQDV